MIHTDYLKVAILILHKVSIFVFDVSSSDTYSGTNSVDSDQFFCIFMVKLDLELHVVESDGKFE